MDRDGVGGGADLGQLLEKLALRIADLRHALENVARYQPGNVDLGTFLGFFLGLVGSYLVQWLLQHRRDNRLRRAMRDAWVQELIQNLNVLDHIERTLKGGLQ